MGRGMIASGPVGAMGAGSVVHHHYQVAPAREFLSREEVAGELGVSETLVDRLLASGELGHARVGKRVVVSREDLRRWYAGARETAHHGGTEARRKDASDGRS